VGAGSAYTAYRLYARSVCDTEAPRQLRMRLVALYTSRYASARELTTQASQQQTRSIDQVSAFDAWPTENDERGSAIGQRSRHVSSSEMTEP